MKKSLFFAAIAAIVMSACQKAELADNNNLPAMQRANIKQNVMLDTISQIICALSDDKAVQMEILDGVNENLYFGMDEELRLRDILFPAESKIIRDPSSIKTLTERFRNAFGVKPNSKLSDNLENEYVNYILENEIHIYFPYSRAITETPTIVVVDVEEVEEIDNPSLIFSAYRKDNGKIQSLKVELNDKFMEERALWIITHNTTPYEDLPRFIVGEFIKKDVIFATRTAKFGLIDEPDEPTYGEFDNPNIIYTLHVGNVICSTTDFDVCKGPEIMFKFITARMNGTDPVKETYTAAKYLFTRKECKNKTERLTTNVLVDDWRVTSIYGGFEVYEEDPGYNTTRNIPIELSVPNYVNFSTTIPIGKYDDDIYKTSLNRVAYFSTAKSDFFNGFTTDGWPRRGAGGNITFAFKYTTASRVY
ncbi:MAG: hypothetical protein LBB53_01140 [Prevotellaceae bacterium]|jgi:hypothetical protein|nr:hypothetical protein [Prevotellaceae bacterium]